MPPVSHLHALQVPIFDLRPFGAPDLKYALKVSRFLVNGRAVRIDHPVVACIDTGTTGLQVSTTLYYSDHLPLPIQTARLEFVTERGSVEVLEASVRRRRPQSQDIPSIDIAASAPEFDEFPFIVSPTPIGWGDGRGIRPYVIFVGLAFLWQRRLTIDVDARRLLIE